MNMKNFVSALLGAVWCAVLIGSIVGLQSPESGIIGLSVLGIICVGLSFLFTFITLFINYWNK